MLPDQSGIPTSRSEDDLKFCTGCDAEVFTDETLCHGCENEAKGMCRWCGETEPLTSGLLCGYCQDLGDLVTDTGNFTDALLILRFRRQLDAIDTVAEIDTL